jgi:hypothetical protein
MKTAKRFFHENQYFNYRMSAPRSNGKSYMSWLFEIWMTIKDTLSDAQFKVDEQQLPTSSQEME